MIGARERSPRFRTRSTSPTHCDAAITIFAMPPREPELAPTRPAPPGRAARHAGLALAASLLLAACGQKGPLYLPDTPAAHQRATLPQIVFGTAGTPRAEADNGQPAPPSDRPELPQPADLE